MDSAERFRTSDLSFAAYLKVAGVPFLEAEREDGRVYFYFERVDGLRELKNEYFQRVAKVPALTYADEIRNMKNLVHET